MLEILEHLPYLFSNFVPVTWSRYIIHFYCLVVEAGFFTKLVLLSACKSNEMGSQVGNCFSSITMLPNMNNTLYDLSVHTFLPRFIFI